ncbi:tRNA pseudouridine(55) synthase TruB [Escherichia coli]
MLFTCVVGLSKYPVEWMVTLEHSARTGRTSQYQDIPAAAELLDPLLMPMDSPASDYPVVNFPLTSSVYFKNGNPVRISGAPLEGWFALQKVRTANLSVRRNDDEGRVAPRRLVVEYPA